MATTTTTRTIPDNQNADFGKLEKSSTVPTDMKSNHTVRQYLAMKSVLETRPTPKEFWKAMRIVYGLFLSHYLPIAMYGQCVLQIIFFKLFNEEQTGEAAAYIGYLGIMITVVGIFSENLGGFFSDIYGRRLFLTLVTMLYCAGCILLILSPTHGMLWVASFFAGLAQCNGAIMPATIADLCDGKEETQFNNAYLYSVFPLIVASLSSSILSSVLLRLGGNYVQIGIATVILAIVDLLYITFVYKETVKGKKNWKVDGVLIKELFLTGIFLPIKKVWSTPIFRRLQVCHMGNKFGTTGAQSMVVALLIYKYNLAPADVALLPLCVYAAGFVGIFYNRLMLIRLGFPTFIGSCYLCGFVWIISLIITSSISFIATLVIVFLGFFVFMTSAPMRTLFKWNVGEHEHGLAMSGYDVMDIVTTSLSTFILNSLFSLIITPTGYSRGSPEAKNDGLAALPLGLCAIGFMAAFIVAIFMLRKMEKDGTLKDKSTEISMTVSGVTEEDLKTKKDNDVEMVVLRGGGGGDEDGDVVLEKVHTV